MGEPAPGAPRSGCPGDSASIEREGGLSPSGVLTVRIASPDEHGRVAAFYRETAYRPPVGPSDFLVVAEDAEGICGAVRLCVEEGVLVMRGMRVALRRRRQGVGTRLLEAAGEAIDGRECFCIPHRHLTGFYGRAGFREIPATECPGFLRERWRQYTEEYRLDVVVMRRLLSRREVGGSP